MIHAGLGIFQPQVLQLRIDLRRLLIGEIRDGDLLRAAGDLNFHL